MYIYIHIYIYILSIYIYIKGHVKCISENSFNQE